MTNTFLKAVHLWWEHRRARARVWNGAILTGRWLSSSVPGLCPVPSTPASHPLLAQPICGVALRGMNVAHLGWLWGPRLQCPFCSESEVHQCLKHSHSKRENTHAPRSCPSKGKWRVSFFPFFFSIKHSWFSVGSCHGYGKISDHLWARFWCKREKGKKKRQINRLQTDWPRVPWIKSNISEPLMFQDIYAGR